MITIGRKSTRYRKRCSYRLEEAIISVANQSVIIFFVLCGHICPKISEVNIIGYYSEVVERTMQDDKNSETSMRGYGEFPVRKRLHARQPVSFFEGAFCRYHKGA